MAGAKEGVSFLEEFQAVGFRDVRLLQTIRNARTQNSKLLTAEVHARK